jgi:hypothetical protein
MYLSQPKRLLPIGALLTGTMLLIGLGSSPIQAADKADQVVSLRIDFDDGSQLHFTELAWSDKMTALDVLNAASKHKRGVKVKVRGTGSFAFVTAIDSQANEGGNGRNWIFQVNGKLAKVGAGVRQVQAGDQVQWLFDRYDEQ